MSVLTHTKAENRKRRLPLYPALILTIILTQIPFVVTLGISTFHWNIMHPDETKFAWFENFKTVVMDEAMRAALKNSITLTFSVVLFSTMFKLFIIGSATIFGIILKIRKEMINYILLVVLVIIYCFIALIRE